MDECFLRVALWDELVGVKANKDSQTVFVKLYQTLRYVFLNLFVAAKQLDKKKKTEVKKCSYCIFIYRADKDVQPTSNPSRPRRRVETSVCMKLSGCSLTLFDGFSLFLCYQILRC